MQEAEFLARDMLELIDQLKRKIALTDYEACQLYFKHKEAQRTLQHQIEMRKLFQSLNSIFERKRFFSYG